MARTTDHPARLAGSWQCVCRVFIGLLFSAAIFSGNFASAADKPARSAIVVPVPLPITGTGDLQVQRMIDAAVDALPTEGDRRTLVLEFRAKGDQQGAGTQLERARSLARYLISPKLSRVRLVAWLPGSVRGHAVLPVLACEEIIMHPDATLGDAGHDETMIDPSTLHDYEAITKQRQTIPLAVVRGMLDKSLAVAKVQTLDGVRYVLADELDMLQKQAAVKEVDTKVKEPGNPANYTGSELRTKYGFVSHLANDRRELAGALGVPEREIEEDPTLARDGKAVLLRLDGPISNDKVSFIIRTLDRRMAADDVNFVCLEIDSAGGSLSDSVRLAHYIAELGSRNIRTVAYVPRQARGDVALVAWACDQLVMTERAVIGGPGESTINPRERQDVVATITDLAKQRERSWSVALALVDPATQLFRHVNDRTKQTAFFTDEEWNLLEAKEKEIWKRGGQVDTTSGVKSQTADELKLARFIVQDFDELRQIYHLENEPEHLQANWAHLLIERLARPEISGFLLFVAFFTLFIELMSPGVSLPGFISAVCFLLFFWAKVLHGTAGTLEIVLFVGGVAFIALEVFVIPGLGVFGIGGVIMVIASVILASQTFVIPRNMYQLEQLPQGLLMVTAAGAGSIVSLVLFRKYIRKAPMLNRMLLDPPTGDALSELSRRESLASFDHLLHKRGTTLTPLTPAGKARFGDEYVDVVSDGDFLQRDVDVYVVEAIGNRVVVRAVS